MSATRWVRCWDVPYRVPDSGGQHSQINERKPGWQEPFAMQGVFLKIVFGGKKKKQTTQIFLLKKCNFIIQAPGLNFAYRLGSKVLSYKSFLLCFPASLYLNPSLDDVLKITCGQEAGVFKGYFFRPQENVIFDVTKKVCHLFSSVRHLKGQ